MSAPLTRWTSWLSMRDRGSRAIEQACRDWRHEAATAGTAGGVMLAHVRSIVGLGRLASLLLLEETAAAIMSGWGWWMLAWIALPLALNHYMLSRHDAHAYASAALADYGILLRTMPFFAFVALVTARSKATAPVLGLIAIVFGLRTLVSTIGWPVVWSYMVRDDVAWWTNTFNGHAPGAWGWWTIVAGTILPSALILLGDRIRRDRSRWFLTLASLAIWAGWLAVAINGQRTLDRYGLDFAVDHPLLLAAWNVWGFVARFPPVLAIAVWMLLIRRQGRQEARA
jgi:hypothetical protein